MKKIFFFITLAMLLASCTPDSQDEQVKPNTRNRIFTDSMQNESDVSVTISVDTTWQGLDTIDISK